MELYIHHAASPTVRKVLMTMAQLDLKPTLRPVDWTHGGAQKPEYLKLNPGGKFPTLVDKGFVLWESNAILVYLAEKTVRLMPTDIHGRADVLRWLFWEAAHFGPAALNLTNATMSRKHFAPEEALAQLTKAFRHEAGLLDDHLHKRQFILDKTLTIADFALASNLIYARQAGLPMTDLHSLSGWLARMSALPAWQDTEPK
ncbi:MAG: glutathione S-transferase family protein [Alphaproteobacteria bacterium]|nr:glutathione S-transferase family protein [Alphaproteobacteria bacterium]